MGSVKGNTRERRFFSQRLNGKPLYDKIRKLARGGMGSTEIATVVGRSESLVNRVCRDLGRKSNRGRVARRNYHHDFLPDDDEANVEKFYVPSPEVIAALAGEIKARNTASLQEPVKEIDPEDERYGDDWYRDE